MKQHSKTDWQRVMREAEADAPVVFDANLEPYDPNDAAAVAVFAAQSKIIRRRGAGRAPLKVPTTIRVDADVLAALKASGKGWQTRVNDMLRDWVRLSNGGI